MNQMRTNEPLSAWNRLPRSYRFLGLLLLLLSFGLASCSSQQGLPNDSAQHRQLLEATLKAWQSGSLGQLAARLPPVRFTDEDQMAGLRLISFTILEPLQAPMLEVELQLRTRQGQSLTRRARYHITLEPRCSVLRAE